MRFQVPTNHPNDIAAWFVAQRGPFVRATGATYHYSEESGVWLPVTESELQRQIHATDGDLFYEERHRRGGSIRQIIRLFPGQVKQVAEAIMWTRFPGDEKFASSPGRGVAMRNGYVEVNALGPNLRPNSPENYATASLPFAYDSGAKAPRFREMLAQIYAKDDAEDRAAKISALAGFYGACLFGLATRFEVCLLLLGAGSNGKSTLMEILEEILFPDLARAVSPDKWDHEYYLESLHRARLNTVSEIPTAKIFASERFKQVITGDTLTGRAPREKPFQFRPTAGHVFSANDLPATQDVTAGFFRRFRILTHTNDFTAAGGGRSSIKGPILAEAPGVLNWAIDGLVSALRTGSIPTPPSHNRILAEWRRGADAAHDFIESCCARDVEALTSVAALYEAYKDWAALTGHRFMSTMTFGRRLTSLGIHKVKRADNTHYKISLRDRQFWIDVVGGGRVEKKEGDG